MTNKDIYSDWIKTQERLPIFLQPWWMDAVCAGKEWDVILVGSHESRGESQETLDKSQIVAVMPYLRRKKWWMKWVLMPQQTQIGGLWLDEHREFTPEELKAICEEVDKQLAAQKLHYYYQQFPVGSPCPEIFKSLKYKIKERVTYRLDDLSDLDQLIDNFSRNKKRQLQKALSLHATRDLTSEEFYTFHQQCLEQKRKKISYSREFFLVLERKSNRHQQSEIIAIRDADEQLMAAGYLVWDKQYAHYLIAAEDESQKNNGAMALLVLECIKLARQKGVAFDFEGSMIRGVAQHFKQFGSKPATYYSVEKYYKWWFWFVITGYKLFHR